MSVKSWNEEFTNVNVNSKDLIPVPLNISKISFVVILLRDLFIYVW